MRERNWFVVVGMCLSASVQISPAAFANGPRQYDSALEAMSDIAKRRAERVASNSVEAAKIERIDWSYGDGCSDAATLLPPPLDGWGVLSDTSIGEWPIAAGRARIVYNYVDESLDPQSADYGASKQNAAIYISSSPAEVQGLEQFLSMPALKETMFEAGPYGYPVQKFASKALVGRYIIQVDGNGDGADIYLQQMIGCAIRSGLIAKGVDKDSLTMPAAH